MKVMTRQEIDAMKKLAKKEKEEWIENARSNPDPLKRRIFFNGLKTLIGRGDKSFEILAKKAVDPEIRKQALLMVDPGSQDTIVYIIKNDPCNEVKNLAVKILDLKQCDQEFLKEIILDQDINIQLKVKIVKKYIKPETSLQICYNNVMSNPLPNKLQRALLEKLDINKLGVEELLSLITRGKTLWNPHLSISLLDTNRLSHLHILINILINKLPLGKKARNIALDKISQNNNINLSGDIVSKIIKNFFPKNLPIKILLRRKKYKKRIKKTLALIKNATKTECLLDACVNSYIPHFRTTIIEYLDPKKDSFKFIKLIHDEDKLISNLCVDKLISLVKEENKDAIRLIKYTALSTKHRDYIDEDSVGRALHYLLESNLLNKKEIRKIAIQGMYKSQRILAIRKLNPLDKRDKKILKKIIFREAFLTFTCIDKYWNIVPDYNKLYIQTITTAYLPAKIINVNYNIIECTNALDTLLSRGLQALNPADQLFLKDVLIFTNNVKIKEKIRKMIF